MIWNFFKKNPPTSEAAQPTLQPVKSAIPLDFLQNLIPIGQLPATELTALNGHLRQFNPGQIIFNRGESADHLMYLYVGSVFLEAANGHGYTTEEATFKAYYPLSNGSEHQFSAVAKTATQIAYLPLSTLQNGSKASLVNNPLLNEHDIPKALRHSEFFQGFCHAYRQDDLQVPSLPDVALRLRAALQKDISIADAVKIVNLDPVIASKLIQVVNSPLYMTAQPISNSHDAINRLGLKITQNLVTSISLSKLFRSTNKTLHSKVQQLWKQSIQIASLSYTLASLTHKINPDEALLAGLIHNIGALPIITYAETLKKIPYTEQELEQTLQLLQAKIGEFILQKWHFPESLQHIPCKTSHWYLDDHPGLQINDIVLLARFHAQLGTPQAQNLPPLNTLPAYLKLGEYSLTPDMSLQALHDAKQQIAESLSFFRS